MSYNKLMVLTEIEHIRKRPGMYVGETNHPTHLLYELLDNALDEATAGHANKVKVKFGYNEDNEYEISVSDNGRGIPQRYNKKIKMYDPVIAATKLHSGGKFDKKAYKISIGLNGIGLVACNALSRQMSIRTFRDGSLFSVKFKDGIPSKPIVSGHDKHTHGTIVSIIPSKQYFDSIKVDEKAVRQRLVLASTFIKDLTITYNGKLIEPNEPEDFIKCDTPVFQAEVEQDNGEYALIYFGYSQRHTKKDINLGSVNLLEVNFGAHIRLLEKALKKAWYKVLSSNVRKFLEEDDVLCGLQGFMYIKLRNPSYTSQIKDTLSASSLKDSEKPLLEGLTEQIQSILSSSKHSKIIEGLTQKFIDYRESQNKLVSNKYLDQAIILGEDGEEVDRSLKKDTKLIDCTSSDREGTELFVIEGDSAGGGLVKLRDQNIHAILPLRGKTLNVVGLEIKRILDNTEIRSLINAFGTGCLQKEDTSRFRYSKIIIATDADVDGLNIRALILGAIAYLTPNLLRENKVYIVIAPLFGQYKRDEFTPVWNQEDLKDGLKTLRFKGLGSMNPNEVAQSILKKGQRKLTKVTVEDILSVTELVGDPFIRKEMLVKKGLIE